jgi:isoleucyl-tRNA synthetase
MLLAQQIVELARALRSENQIKIRQPLASISVFVETEAERKSINNLQDIICDELNVKSLNIAEDISKLATRKAKANFQVIGPKYGKSVKKVALIIQNLTTDEIAKIESDLFLEKTLSEEKIRITSDYFDVIHEKKDALIVSTQNGITVALDTQLTDELINEGLTREFVSKMQNLRKEKKFDVVDRINVQVHSSQKIRTAIKSQIPYIKEEILAASIKFLKSSNKKNKIEIENEIVYVELKKV